MAKNDEYRVTSVDDVVLKLLTQSEIEGMVYDRPACRYFGHREKLIRIDDEDVRTAVRARYGIALQ